MSLIIYAVGDMMFGEQPLCSGFGIKKFINLYGADSLFQNVHEVLSGGDLVFGNLETVISSTTNKKGFEADQFRSEEKIASTLYKNYFTALSVANNHTMNHGPECFNKTIEILKNNGITPVGVRSTVKIISIKNIKVALLGYSFIEDSAKIKGYNNVVEESLIINDLLSAQKNADVTIISLHWGYEYVSYPSRGQIELGRKLIDYGADIILGHHSHVIQGYEIYKGKPIIYGMGNFIFDHTQIDDTRKSIIVKIIVTNGEYTVNIIPIICDMHSYVPKIAEGECKKDIFQIINNTKFLIENKSINEYLYSNPELYQNISIISRKKCMKEMKFYFIKNILNYSFPVFLKIIITYFIKLFNLCYFTDQWRYYEDKKKIYHVYPVYLDNTGGVPVLIQSLAESLSNDLYTEVICLKANISKNKFVKNVFIKKFKSSYFGFIEIPSLNWIKYIKNLRNSIVHIHGFHNTSTFLALLLIHKSNIVFFNPYYHGKSGKQYITYILELYKYLFNTLAISRCDVVICLSKFEKSLIKNEIDISQDNIYVIPPGFKKSKILNYKYLYNGNPIKKILYVGRVVRHKNVDKIVEALSYLDNFNLTIVGSGEDVDKIKSMIAVNGLSQRVTWKNSISYDQLLEEYSKSDIFILPSIYETFGMVVGEATLVGCPTLVANSYALKDFIEAGLAGEINIPINGRELAKIILNHPSKSPRELAVKYFKDWTDISEMYLNLYRSFIDAKR